MVLNATDYDSQSHHWPFYTHLLRTVQHGTDKVITLPGNHLAHSCLGRYPGPLSNQLYEPLLIMIPRCTPANRHQWYCQIFTCSAANWRNKNLRVAANLKENKKAKNATHTHTTPHLTRTQESHWENKKWKFNFFIITWKTLSLPQLCVYIPPPHNSQILNLTLILYIWFS